MFLFVSTLMLLTLLQSPWVNSQKLILDQTVKDVQPWNIGVPFSQAPSIQAECAHNYKLRYCQFDEGKSYTNGVSISTQGVCSAHRNGVGSQRIRLRATCASTSTDHQYIQSGYTAKPVVYCPAGYKVLDCEVETRGEFYRVIGFPRAQKISTRHCGLNTTPTPSCDRYPCRIAVICEDQTKQIESNGSVVNGQALTAECPRGRRMIACEVQGNGRNYSDGTYFTKKGKFCRTWPNSRAASAGVTVKALATCALKKYVGTVLYKRSKPGPKPSVVCPDKYKLIHCSMRARPGEKYNPVPRGVITGNSCGGSITCDKGRCTVFAICRNEQ